MRAPFQVLILPYRFTDEGLKFGVFRRSDGEVYQFVSGGGEDDETPLAAAKRELFEETGIRVNTLIELKSIAYIPTNVYAASHRANWPKDLYVLPEHSFAFECNAEPALSDEHLGYEWLIFDDAWEKLTYDSNRTAMHEIKCILEHKDARED